MKNEKFEVQLPDFELKIPTKKKEKSKSSEMLKADLLEHNLYFKIMKNITTNQCRKN